MGCAVQTKDKTRTVDGKETLTFGGAKQGLSSQSKERLDFRNTGWDLLLYQWTYPPTNLEQIVCRNVLVQNHLQKSMKIINHCTVL